MVAALFVLVLSALLVVGIKETAASNNAFVVVKIAALVVFVCAGLALFHPGNLVPFAPYGWGRIALGASGNGIVPAAALVFFTYIGFDTATTTAEETRDPKRDVPIGVLGSLAIGTVIYCAVALVLVGDVPWRQVDQNAALLAALAPLHNPLFDVIITIGVIAGTTSVALTSLLGQSRIFYVMARDRMLPPAVAAIDPRFKTPARMTAITGIIVALLAFVVPLDALLELVNIGTFSAFIIVCAGVIWLRTMRPDLPRPFRSPLVPFFPICGIVLSLFLSSVGLGTFTWLRFIVWLAIGSGSTSPTASSSRSRIRSEKRSLELLAVVGGAGDDRARRAHVDAATHGIVLHGRSERERHVGSTHHRASAHRERRGRQQHGAPVEGRVPVADLQRQHVGAAAHGQFVRARIEARDRAGRFADGPQREIGDAAGGNRGDIGNDPLTVDVEQCRLRERE